MSKQELLKLMRLLSALESVMLTKEKVPDREWQGLTDEEIADIYIKWDATPGVSHADFARAIEAKLKEKHESK
jgi:hypothetical protein